MNKALIGHGLVRATYSQQVVAASLLLSNAVFTNPSGSNESYEVVGIHGYWDVVGGASAAAQVRKVPTGTAQGSGTIIHSSANAFDLTATARAPQRAALATSAATRRIDPGDSVAVTLSGTLTGLVGLVVVVTLKGIKGSRSLR